MSRYQVIVTFRTKEESTPDKFGPKGAVDLNTRTQTYVAAPGEELVFAVPEKLEALSFTVDEVIDIDESRAQ